MKRTDLGAFTLIELSIVLVIIGLIVGGVLAGQELIRAAAVRATLAQVEGFQTAVNTFKGKYGYLPGDIPNPYAAQFGFVTRGSYAGEGDGNGFIEGVDSNAANQQDLWNVAAGESAMVWVDLSAVRLIPGTFTTASPTTMPGSDVTGANVGLYMPPAKLGKGNYIYVWAGGYKGCFLNNSQGPGDNMNYFAISAVSGINMAGGGEAYNTVNLTPNEAYLIDNKADDGLPQTGNILALAPYYTTTNDCWVAGGPSGTNNVGAQNSTNGGPTNAATPGSSTTCYDNNNGSGPQKYSVTQNNGNNVTCGISFRFQ